MFSLGFEPQVRSLLGQVRPDRQTVLFSATFRPALERLARDALSEPVRVTVGEVGEANDDVTQVVEVLPNADAKWGWLVARLPHFAKAGTVLVFVSQKAQSEELARSLAAQTGEAVDAIHGDRTQAERQEALRAFKRGSTRLLVATDVASRGLDIPAIKTVINFDVARRAEDHTHRIGRTGRAGATDGTVHSGHARRVRRCRRPRSVAALGLAGAAARPDRPAQRSRRWAASGLAEPKVVDPPSFRRRRRRRRRAPRAAAARCRSARLRRFTKWRN